MTVSQTAPEIPQPLQADHITAEIIRHDIWRPAVLEDDWRVIVFVGREGSGKSLTCASVLRAVDPTFGVERTHFDPVPFLQDVGREQDRPGVAAMSDESGVGFGNRTWHDREQIEANQYLQTARDDNRIVGLTLPRLEELDIQLQGRIHVLVEVVGKRDGEWVEVKWKRMNPSRSGEGKIYKKYPRDRVSGRIRKVTRLKIGPPPAEYVEPYKRKKSEWKDDLKDSVIDTYQEDEQEEELSPKEVADDIMDGGDLQEYVKSNNGQRWVAKDLIAAVYEIGDRKSKKVKELLLREVDDDVM